MRDIEKLLKVFRERKREEFLRPFLGSADILQRVAVKKVFPASGIVVLSPVEIHDAWPAVVLEGPEFQINFLYDFLLNLAGKTSSVEDGKWTGVCKKNAERIDLFYTRGKYWWERILLAEYVFRADAMAYANLKLSEVSELEMVYNNQTTTFTEIPLPDGVKNGEIDLPAIAFLQ